MKEEKGNMFSARYDHRPYRIIAIKGTRAIAERGRCPRSSSRLTPQTV